MFSYVVIGKIRCGDHYIPKPTLDALIFEYMDAQADQEDYERERHSER